MKLLTLGSALAFLPVLFASANAADDESELRHIQDRLTAAWVQRERNALEQLLAPEWSAVTPETLGGSSAELPEPR